MYLIYFIIYSSIILCVAYNYDKCKRFYPYDNLLKTKNKICNKNIFSYSFLYQEWKYCNGINCRLIKERVNKDVLFFTIADSKSIKYIINSYVMFYNPYEIKSLVTFVNDRYTLYLCIKNNIFCVYDKLPSFINELNTSHRNKLFYLKYYYIYNFLKNRITILYVDSDVVFIQNCIEKLVNRKEDLILLKSQLKNIFGNAGIMYIYSIIFIEKQSLLMLVFQHLNMVSICY